ncbi:uncharacterized protein LOC133929129 isoform X2 [Phragmites australis]|nr:uncharacterized protein LOC133929129 isoform X2 [Phragmites australis]
MEALTGGRPLSAREEELLGLLASFPDGGEYGSDSEMSFSDLVVEAGARTSGADQCAAAPREDRRSAAALSPERHESALKQQRGQVARQRRQRIGGGRGSSGGGGDGVLLNVYVPGLLTRSMTAPRPGRGALPPGAAAKAAAGKSR